METLDKIKQRNWVYFIFFFKKTNYHVNILTIEGNFRQNLATKRRQLLNRETGFSFFSRKPRFYVNILHRGGNFRRGLVA